MKAKATDNKEFTIALAGNPNSGKTSLFNALTGSRQHVGNWPGVTVEKKEGSLIHNGASIKIVDLPGTYSLTAFSMEEIISRNYIVDCKPEVVVDVIDASNLERNLYLALQIIELGTTKTVIALNMIDVAKSMGHKINVDLLSELLGVPVVPTIARTEKGMKELLDTALAVADGESNKKEIKISYGKEIEDEITRLEAEIERAAFKCEGFSPRWLAVKLLENDLKIRKHTGSMDNGAQLLAESDRSRAHISSLFRQDAELVIADMRYGFISGLIREVLVKPVENVRTATDRIDGILMNRILGAPLFALFMYIAFTLTFTLGDPP
nr:ferrous iron transporter B [bacterium]